MGMSQADADQSALADGEVLRWKKKANRWQHRWRAVGGHLLLTDRRLIFRPHAFDAALDGEVWSADLGDLREASLSGLLRWVRIEDRQGDSELFVIWPPKKTRQALSAAIEEAGRRT